MKIGFHIPRIEHSTEKSVEAIAERAAPFKMTCMQIFAVGPQNHKVVLTAEDETYLRDKCVVIHGAYIDNPWNSAPGTIHNIKVEFGIAQNIGAAGVIVHLSAAANAHKHKIIDQLDVEKYAGVTLFLEINAARASANTFETPEKINTFFADLKPKHIKLGLCIDTAHLYSCGVALTTADDAKRFLRELKVSGPIMFHLNDSGGVLGAGKDLHESLCDGNIWKKYKHNAASPDSGFYYILKYAKKNNHIVILERHEGVIKDDVEVLKHVFI